MSVVTIHQAKTNLSRLIEQASEGEEVIIARGSKPVARLVPVGEVKGKRQPGSLKGKLQVGPEFFEPLPLHELSGWESSSCERSSIGMLCFGGSPMTLR
jgi:prevent-host-death family protein